MSLTWRKDPADQLDYGINWAGWFDEPVADSVTAAEWTVADGLEEVASSLIGDVAVIRLAGGTAGVTYDLVCHVTTADGQEADQSVRVRVEDR